MERPKVQYLGTAVIEQDGQGRLVMLPDGAVSGYLDHSAAISAIKKYFRKVTPKDAIGVGEIASFDGSLSAVTVGNIPRELKGNL